jgi:methylmalonyl-CoA mutase cobalamin-binding domain/chain
MMSDTLVLSAGHQLRDRSHALSEAIVACEFGRYPGLRARYGPAGRARSRDDAACHVCTLADAVDVDSPALFQDHVGWAKVLLAQRGVREDDLRHLLDCMAEVVRAQMPPPVAAAAVPLIENALAGYAAMPSTTAPAVDASQRLAGLASDYLHALLSGYRGVAARLAFDAAERGEPVRDLYLQVFQPALREIGRLWQMNRINVAQEHFCSAATQVLMSQLLPLAPATERRGHRVVVVCVQGDLHDLGARMVADFFDMAGWDTCFCGASMPHEAVVQAVVQRGAQVLAISASMACHVHTVQELIAALLAEPGCAGLRVLAGGHPFNVDPALWRAVGADGTAEDAQGAVALAAGWMAGR